MRHEIDMGTVAVTERLKAASAFSDLSIQRAFEGKVNMEPAAVTARLRSVSQMRNLGLRLGGIAVAPKSG